MIPYNQQNPFIYIFKLKSGDTFLKILPFLILYALYTWGICYLILEHWTLPKNSNLSNIANMHTLLGVVISILLVFRTNTAYDRWWEGRKLWGGLVNNSRNFAMKINALLPDTELDTKTFFSKTIAAYAYALHDHLHKENTRIELFEDEKVNHIFNGIDERKHIPNQLALLMYKKIQELYLAKKIDGSQLLFINDELQSFTDTCGACERIKNTPIPFSYSVFIKKFIFVYVATLPVGYVFSLQYLAIPVSAFIFYVLVSLEIIAEEIEDPFGGDTNDLPTNRLAKNIERNVADIFEKQAA